MVLIGKGLTFDSGGYNLKAGAGSMIELMKFDMGGAGAVLGAAKALAEMEPAGACVRACGGWWGWVVGGSMDGYSI